MSLLHQNAQEPLDDASQGEELTKGTSHIVIAGVIAAIVVTIGIVFYFVAGQKPPVATGEVLQIWAHPIHVETSGLDANGEAMAKKTADQILVFARIRFHNQSNMPITMHDVMSDATLDDGVHSSYAASAVDFDRMFVAFPEVASFREAPLPTERTLNPGETVEGLAVTSYRVSKAQWDARKDLSYSIAIKYQPKILVKLKTPVEWR